jgi:hypothetical protein
MKNLLLLLVFMLVGCGPSVTLGPGTIDKLDGKVNYIQDDGWIFATSQTSIEAATLAGWHCDRFYIYRDSMGYVGSVNGKNCHAPSTEFLQTPSSIECVSADSSGYKFVPCKP